MVHPHTRGAGFLPAIRAVRRAGSPPHAWGRQGLGRAARVESEGNKRDGVERRFVALLNASPHDLAEHLRHAIALLRSKKIPVDWAQLLRDVQDWNWPNHPVQRNWARAFWAAFPTAVTDADAITAPTPGDAQ
jgi:CRISPR system Cascade subunit CasB